MVTIWGLESKNSQLLARVKELEVEVDSARDNAARWARDWKKADTALVAAIEALTKSNETLMLCRPNSGCGSEWTGIKDAFTANDHALSKIQAVKP